MAAPVTICVPVYNVERYIERCARSLFEQTFPDIEYLFVDDCSPDNSIQLLNEITREYPQRMPHVHIIRHEVNRGSSVARNTAVDSCRTEFLIHVDSDDFLEKNAVELLIDKQKEGDYDIVTGNAKILHADRTEVLRINEPTEKDLLIKEYIKPSLNHVLWGRLIRTSLYTENHLAALEGCNMGEDHQITPRLFYFAQKVAAINDCLYNYNCTNSQSYMARASLKEDFSKKIVQDLKAFEILYDFFSNRGEQDYSKCVATELAKYIYKVTPVLVARRQKKEFHFAWSYYYRISNNYEGVSPKNKIISFVKRHYYLYSFLKAVKCCFRK